MLPYFCLLSNLTIITVHVGLYNNLLSNNFLELQLQFLQLLTRHFKQLYERVYITTVRYIFPTIRIVDRIVQMYTDLKKYEKEDGYTP